MVNLYSYISDYAGTTYIRQAYAEDETAAVIELAKMMYDELGQNWECPLHESEPTQIEGLQNIWCVSAVLNDSLFCCHFSLTLEGNQK